MFRYTPQANNYILYIRKSTDVEDKQIASLDTQINEMSTFVEQGFNIRESIQEKKSAFKTGRPEFNRMVSLIEKGKIDGILAYDINRIARNAYDAGVVMQLLSDGKLKHIQTKTANYTPKDNLLHLYVEMAMAHQDSRTKAVFVSDGMRAKAFRGYYPVGRILGYYHVKPNPDEGLKEDIRIKPHMFKNLKKLWKMALSGDHSLLSIHEEAIKMDVSFNNRGSISYNAVSNMFKNEFYAGYFYWKDKNGIKVRIKGKHKPIVTMKEFEKVQDIHFKKKKTKVYKTKESFYFRGILPCSKCKSAMVAERKSHTRCTKCSTRFSSLKKDYCPRCKTQISKMNSPWQLNKVYIGCGGRKYGCKQKYIELDRLTQEFNKRLNPLGISERYYRIMKKAIVRSFEKDTNLEKAEKKHLKKKLSEMLKRKDNLMEMRMDGEISSEIYKTKSKEISSKIEDIRLQLESSKEALSKNMTAIIEACDILHLCGENFQYQPNEIKRKILKAFDSNLFINEKKLEFSIPKLHESIKKTEQAYIRKFNRLESLIIQKYQPKSTEEEEISYLLAEVRKVRHP